MEVIMSDVTWDEGDLDTPEIPAKNLSSVTTWTLFWSEEREVYCDHTRRHIQKKMFECNQTHTDYEQALLHWQMLKKARLRVEMVSNDDITLYRWQKGKRVVFPEAYEVKE
jgi:hypothetical protein